MLNKRDFALKYVLRNDSMLLKKICTGGHISPNLRFFSRVTMKEFAQYSNGGEQSKNNLLGIFQVFDLRKSISLVFALPLCGIGIRFQQFFLESDLLPLLLIHHVLQRVILRQQAADFALCFLLCLQSVFGH